jgi:LmbE family N-acetylglucosaminyl deacetylase
MLALSLSAATCPLKLLCLGAHPDDIEIGGGGTVLHLAAQSRPLSVHWIVFTGDTARGEEARDSAAAFLAAVPDRTITVHDFRDGFLPYQGAAVKDAFERLKRSFEPSLILTHSIEDAHQDHRLIGELTHQTFRDHLILEYEIPKHDGDLGNPNLFVPLSEREARRKAAALLEHFPSQRQRRWFAEDVFLAMMRLRGAFSNAPEGYAEGFLCRKAILG